MDDFDRLQLDQQQSKERLISESVSLENAKRAYEVRTHKFSEGTATEQHVIDEMQFTYMSCSPCEIKETK